MTGVLEGTKVVEMGHLVAVPAAGATMADWGAEVIKIEPPNGEMARGLHVLKDREDPAAGLPTNNWYFHVLNRNKKAVGVNLKTEAGRDIVYKLVREADVFMSNYETATAAALGMDYETLCQVNPKLVYASLTGYGTAGPDKDLRGLDWTAGWPRSGIMYTLAQSGGVPPAPRGGMIDRVTGANIVGGVCAALLHKEKTGEGQKIEFSLYHTGVWTIVEDIQAALVGKRLPKFDRATPPSPTMNCYRTKDKKWFWLSGLGTTWEVFCEVIGRPDLVDDPLYLDAHVSTSNMRALVRLLGEIFASKTRSQWDKIFRKYDLVFGWAASPAEIVRDKQALANDFFPSLQHPDDKEMRIVATPVRFCQNPASVRVPAPEVGQHTEETLLELGYCWEDIAGLKEQGVIL